MARKQVIDLSDEIARIKKYSADVCRTAAGLIRDELTKTAAEAIELFYQNYDPSSYDRHYYNFRENSFEKYYAKSGNYYYGGVKLTPENMEDIYTRDKGNPQEVFESVYAGFHGPIVGYMRAGFQIPIMNPSPMDLIVAKRDEIVTNPGKYIQNAKKIVNRR